MRLNYREINTSIITAIGLFGGAIIGVLGLYSWVLLYAIETRDASTEVMAISTALAFYLGWPIGAILGAIISRVLLKKIKIKFVAVLFVVINGGMVFYINHLYDKISPPIVRAVSSNRIGKVRSIIRSGADLNIESIRGRWTALELASHRGYLDIVESLVDGGADINESGALTAAVRDRQIPIIMFLIKAGADVNYKGYGDRTALMVAATKNDVTVVNILIDKGADIEAKDVEGTTALMKAVKSRIRTMGKLIPANQVASVKALIRAGADINAKDIKGKTALMHAAQKKDVSLVKTIIELEADINIKDVSGKTALIYAVEEDNLERWSYLTKRMRKRKTAIAKLLVETGADINTKTNDGKTALIKGAEKKDASLVKTLIELEADVNIKDVNGKTALMYAVEEDDERIVNVSLGNGRSKVDAETIKSWSVQIEAVRGTKAAISKMLIDAGADIKAKNNDGLTVLDIADRAGNANIVQILQQAESLGELNLRLQK